MTLVVVALVCLAAGLIGCAGRKARPVVNPPLIAPYAEPRIWAVAPLTNESGVSAVDALRLSDVLAEEAQRVQGLEVLPVQRVLDAMRAMNLGQVQSPEEARALAQLVGADAILVGTIGAYDPYDPPKLGMALQLFEASGRTGSSLDTRTLSTAPSGAGVEAGWTAYPSSGASGLFDAADNGVRLQLEAFAKGRSDPTSALGWKRYLVSMDLYAQFVSQRLLWELLSQERIRMHRTTGFSPRT